jgi:hypothetical protein
MKPRAPRRSCVTFLVERSIPVVGLSARAPNRHPALKNEAYKAPGRDAVTDTPEVSRDGAVRRGEAAPRRAPGLVPAPLPPQSDPRPHAPMVRTDETHAPPGVPRRGHVTPG